MCVSMDGSTLVSGSHDFNVKIWDISSRQCVRTIPHRGSVVRKAMEENPLALAVVS